MRRKMALQTFLTVSKVNLPSLTASDLEYQLASTGFTTLLHNVLRVRGIRAQMPDRWATSRSLAAGEIQ